jgi:hypothetical protein
MKMIPFVIPIEAADQITLVNLQEARRYMLNELKQHKKGDYWIHPEDIGNYEGYLKALDVLIPYYGG